MSEQSFEQMLNESFKTIHTGEVVEGTVISVKPDEIILNIVSICLCNTYRTINITLDCVVYLCVSINAYFRDT